MASRKSENKSVGQSDSQSDKKSGKLSAGNSERKAEGKTNGKSKSLKSMSHEKLTSGSGTTLRDISKKMSKLDLCMMTTIGADGMTASRPMSNNGDVEYDGNSYFFTWGKSKLARDLKKNSSVNLSFAGKKNLFISVSGKAKLVRSRKEMEKHWVPDLEKWFGEGLDTPDLVMVAVKAQSLHLWQNELEEVVEFN